jgi:alpha-L-fucosidase
VKAETQKPYTEADFRFTTKEGRLYAIGYVYPAKGEATIGSFATGKARIERVTLVGKQSQPVKFTQSTEGLVVTLPQQIAKSEHPYALRIEGEVPLGI